MCVDVLANQEIVRNSFGTEWSFRFSPECSDPIVSSLPGVFPTIPTSMSAVEVGIPWLSFALCVSSSSSSSSYQRQCVCTPTMPRSFRERAVMRRCLLVFAQPFHAPPAAEFVCKPIPGCVVPAPGFPTLHSLPLSVARSKVNVNVFGMGASKKESVVLVVEDGRVDAVTGEVMPAHTPTFSSAYAPDTWARGPPSENLHFELAELSLRDAAGEAC